MLFRPGHPALVVAGALEATNVYLTAAVLQGIADTVYGLERTPVAFASSRPTSPALGRYWSGLTRWAADTGVSALLAEPLVRTDLTRRLAVGMLECFPLTGDRETRSLSMAAQARRYRVAVAFLDDNAQSPVTVEDAALAAHTTTTALVRAFRAHHPLGHTPGQYLRRVRLAGAHEDLLQGGSHHRGHGGGHCRPVGLLPPGSFRRRLPLRLRGPPALDARSLRPLDRLRRWWPLRTKAGGSRGDIPGSCRATPKRGPSHQEKGGTGCAS